MSLRKPRRTAAQIQALLADYHSSGLTRAAFCTARRLPLSTLDAYRRRATPSLLEVDISSTPSTNAPLPQTLALVLADGRRLELPCQAIPHAAPHLALLLRHLREV
jgi:hypothetical protein